SHRDAAVSRDPFRRRGSEPDRLAASGMRGPDQRAQPRRARALAPPAAGRAAAGRKWRLLRPARDLSADSPRPVPAPRPAATTERPRERHLRPHETSWRGVRPLLLPALLPAAETRLEPSPPPPSSGTRDLGNAGYPVMSGVWWKSERKASSSGAVEPQLRPLAAG